MSSNSTQRMNCIAAQHGVILLYHSIAESVPPGLQNTLHNVQPKILQRHLEQLQDYFQFVSLEDFADAVEKKGLAAITFDDGYKNVLENALPILEELRYPATLFLNPITFTKKWNWRDKVRYLIHHDLIEEFERDYKFEIKKGRFYRYSKHSQNDSANIDMAMDKFLLGHQIDIYPEFPYLQEPELVSHPLITYGNHSLNHYVLSSLSSQQQQVEIESAKNMLSQLHENQLSRSFSAPFGGNEEINAQTIFILVNLDYKNLLMSRQQLQTNIAESDNIQILERFMPRSNDIISEIAGIFKN